MIDVTIATYEQDIIEASAVKPVLVDFWAPWCSPCKILGPILEKLDAEYAGRFILTKVNIDESPDLAAMFGVRSVPTCILIKDGRAVDGFLGAQPEAQVRSFLEKHIGAEALFAPQEENGIQDQAEEVEDDDAILERLQHAVAADPANDNARFDYVKLLLQLGRFEDAKRAFTPVKDKAISVRRFDSLQRWIEAIGGEWDKPADMTALEAAIAANKRDFAARYARAQALMAQGKFTAAMDELLEILMRDKAWDEERARKTYIAILDIMEPPRLAAVEGRIPDEDPTVVSYRRRLSSVVLS